LPAYFNLSGCWEIHRYFDREKTVATSVPRMLIGIALVFSHLDTPWSIAVWMIARS
jgi:hypothetical protein